MGRLDDLMNEYMKGIFDADELYKQMGFDKDDSFGGKRPRWGHTIDTTSKESDPIEGLEVLNPDFHIPGVSSRVRVRTQQADSVTAAMDAYIAYKARKGGEDGHTGDLRDSIGPGSERSDREAGQG